MKFSVIIPVYKAEAYLDICIKSVLSQSFSDFEIILIDDGSPDRSPVICDKYASMDNRVKVLHEENGGVSVARNKGISVASGEIICFLDADDEWKRDFLQNVNKLYCMYPQIGGSFTARYNRYPNGSEVLLKMDSSSTYFILPKLLGLLEYCRTSSFTVKRDAFNKLSLFREHIKRGEDADLILRLSCIYPIGYCNIPLLVYNVSTPNNSRGSSALYYFPFEEWYNYPYPIKSDLVIHTSGLLIRKVIKLIREVHLYEGLKTIMKIKFGSYLKYKFNIALKCRKI